MNAIDILANSIFNYKNVVAYSMTPKLKISNGIVTDEPAIRIYVSKKEPLAQLRDYEVLPNNIEGMSTDVYEIGELMIRPPTPLPWAVNDNRRDVVRPLVSGISIGNWAITAGTLGWFSEKDGEIFLDSNAHVFTDDSSKEVPLEKRIIQPGKYDGGTLKKIVADYVWHDRVIPENENSGCEVSGGVVSFLNGIAKLIGAKTRFTTYVEKENYQDFAVSSMKEDILFLARTYDFDILDIYALVGKLFAGSNQCTIFCKVKYQIEAGYIPVYVETAEVEVGDIIRKSGRTTYDTNGVVIDESAVTRVNYGNYIARITDVFLTKPMSEGGDSGSAAWTKLA